MTDYRWYITIAALREYHRICGISPEDESPEWWASERELAAHCAAAKLSSERDGQQTWRTGRVHIKGVSTRLEFTVSLADRPEGDLPQLVRVRNKGARPGQGRKQKRE